MRNRELAILLAMGSLALAGCGGANYDATTGLGMQAIIDQVNLSLTTGDCASALSLITPVLNSANTNNQIRLLAASAYGCNAHIDFMPLLGALSQANPPLASNGGFWIFDAKQFPSTAGKDYVPESGQLALDTLESILNPGVVLLPQNAINSKTFNPGSPFTADRTADANMYMTFVSMATVGGLENRYGAPDATGHKTQNLPWTKPNQVTADGCAFSSAFLDFLDTVGISAAAGGGGVATSLNGALSLMQNAVNMACQYGCSGGTPTAVDFATMGIPAANQGSWVATACAFSCTSCPTSLRNRAACTQLATDINSCAAAAITQFVNLSTAGWN